MRSLQIFEKISCNKNNVQIKLFGKRRGGTLRGRSALLGVYIATLTAERIKEKRGGHTSKRERKITRIHARTNNAHARTHA